VPTSGPNVIFFPEQTFVVAKIRIKLELTHVGLKSRTYDIK